MICLSSGRDDGSFDNPERKILKEALNFLAQGAKKSEAMCEASNIFFSSKSSKPT